MTSFRAVNDGPTAEGAAHSRVRVFAGPDEDHRALAGALIFTNHEAMDFASRVNGSHWLDEAPKSEAQR